MIYENGPEGMQTVPLTWELARQLDEEYAAIEDAAFSYDRRRLRGLLDRLRSWVSSSPFPNVIAHAIEYGRELDAVILHPVEYPDPEPPRMVAVEDARKRWTRKEIVNQPRSAEAERIFRAIGGYDE